MDRVLVRAIAIGLVVILAAALLKFLPPIVVLVLFIVGIAYAYKIGRERARSPEVRGGTVELLGLRHETTDPFGVVGFPVTLFGRAGDPEVGELVWGSWRGLDVHAFELTLTPPSVMGESRGRDTFACAMATVEGPLPGLVAEPQLFLTHLQTAPPGATIEFDDPPFDAALNVWSDDEAFARRVLDEPARRWLQSLGGHWGVEVRGKIAILYGPKPDHPDLIGTLDVLRELLGRLPSELTASAAPPASEPDAVAD
jgi:hypothetical protein